MDIKPIFAERLKEARTKAKINQASLAECCGINQSSISSFEKGTSAPNLEVAANMAERLGVSLNWLCGFGEQTQNITSLQWLCYMDKLINSPPTVQHKALVRFRLGKNEESAAAIEFCGEDMQKFFTAYAALMGTKKQISGDVYENLIKTVFEGYSELFTPGYTVVIHGANTATPPPMSYQ